MPAPDQADRVVWRPDPAQAAQSAMAALYREVFGGDRDLTEVLDGSGFRRLHRWSIDHPESFWATVWRANGVIADRLPSGEEWAEVVTGFDRMAPPSPPAPPPFPETGPHWFRGARLNFAENLLRYGGAEPAIIAWDEHGRRDELSWDDLRHGVAAVSRRLLEVGVGVGDRVAGWMPNIPETIIAMLASTTIGAVWTSCSPDFGVDGIVDRFGQTEPVVLFWCDGYRYNGKTHDCIPRLRELLDRLPSVRTAVMVHWDGSDAPPHNPRIARWTDWLATPASDPPPFARLPFEHPAYILYSSGTTGLPKGLVHSAGGTLLQHLKEHRYHCDITPRDRLFYFTTCGWMMWNWQVTALAQGATLMLYDGAAMPNAEPDVLWRMAEEEGTTVFGTSAKYLALAEKEAMHPARDHALDRVRLVLSTGSPLAPDSFDWVAQAIGSTVHTASISGGTDIVSCFVLGNPISPVYRGEIQGPGLGMAVDVFDAEGHSCAVGQPGELVCTRPFPSMPVAFWNDPDGTRYRAAYFNRYPGERGKGGVWHHGDWIARTAHEGYRISGRSDATLNPGGVRLGTAEIYRQVEAFPEVMESLVAGQRTPAAPPGDERVVLLVRLCAGEALTTELGDAIRRRIREAVSPHHVPHLIVAVDDLPRTRSGKLSELAVRAVLEGRPVANVGALANPDALDALRRCPELGLDTPSRG